MELSNFFESVYDLSHLTETRVYYKNLLTDKAKNFLLKKLQRAVKRGCNYFTDSKSNTETFLAFGIGTDEIKRFVIDFMKPENLMCSINNISENFKTDNDELFLCSGYVNLADLRLPEKSYDGYANPPKEDFHFYFKFGFTDNGSKAVIASFHRVYEPKTKNMYYLKGQKNFYFDDSKREEPRYGLLKGYVNAWINIRLAGNTPLYREYFNRMDLDNDVRGKKNNFVLRGKPDTNLTKDEFDVLKHELIISKFDNLYDFKNENAIKMIPGSHHNTDVVVDLVVKGDEI